MWDCWLLLGCTALGSCWSTGGPWRSSSPSCSDGGGGSTRWWKSGQWHQLELEYKSTVFYTRLAILTYNWSHAQMNGNCQSPPPFWWWRRGLGPLGRLHWNQERAPWWKWRTSGIPPWSPQRRAWCWWSQDCLHLSQSNTENRQPLRHQITGYGCSLRVSLKACKLRLKNTFSGMNEYLIGKGMKSFGGILSMLTPSGNS